MKKATLALSMAVLCLCLLLGACFAGKLPEGFVKEDVISKAEGVITLLSSKDYEGTAATFSDKMGKSLDAKSLESAIGSQLDDLGEFKEFKSEATVGKKDATIGDYAVAVIVCAYENGSATFTISIDANGDTCGLYMK